MSNLIMMMSGKQRLIQVATCLFTGRGCRSFRRPELVVVGVGGDRGVVRHFGGASSEGGYRGGGKRHWREKVTVSPQLEYRKLLEEAGINEKLDKVRNTEGFGEEITIPIHLVKKLERRKEKESEEWAVKQRYLEASRRGDKSNCLIHCKDHKLNHYKGQSYDKKEDVALASRAWRHRKSAGDFFTIFPKLQKHSPFYMADTGEMTFEDLGINELVCRNLKLMGITTPTHIQVFGIPELLKGKYTIVAAETGCGKTLVYLLSAVNQILMNRRYRVRQKPAHPSVVILTPSRELSDQIFKVARDLTSNLGITVKLVQGGSLGLKIKNPPQTNVDILIATTNAIKVLSTAGVYGMTNVQHIILDEADTLLDDSFFPELVGPFLNRFPWDDIQRDLQLTLVGATLPKNIDESLGQFIKTDDFATCSTPGLHYLLPHVTQTFLRLKKSQKADKIKEIVEKDVENKIPVIIFCNRTATCNWLASYLNENGIDCAAVNGKMPPKIRDGRIEFYKRGELNVLVCTDLASRGIDTVRTQHVINYEFPLHTADYIHRCGRTGRVGSLKNCRVTNFISRMGEIQAVQELERSVRKENAIPDVNANIKRMYKKHYGEFIEIEPINEKEDTKEKRKINESDEDEVDGDESESEEEEEEEEDEEAVKSRPRRT